MIDLIVFRALAQQGADARVSRKTYTMRWNWRPPSRNDPTRSELTVGEDPMSSHVGVRTGELRGMVGAIRSVPTAAILQVVFEELTTKLGRSARRGAAIARR